MCCLKCMLSCFINYLNRFSTYFADISFDIKEDHIAIVWLLTAFVMPGVSIYVSTLIHEIGHCVMIKISAKRLGWPVPRDIHIVVLGLYGKTFSIFYDHLRLIKHLPIGQKEIIANAKSGLISQRIFHVICIAAIYFISYVAKATLHPFLIYFLLRALLFVNFCLFVCTLVYGKSDRASIKYPRKFEYTSNLDPVRAQGEMLLYLFLSLVFGIISVVCFYFIVIADKSTLEAALLFLNADH